MSINSDVYRIKKLAAEYGIDVFGSKDGMTVSVIARVPRGDRTAFDRAMQDCLTIISETSGNSNNGDTDLTQISDTETMCKAGYINITNRNPNRIIAKRLA